MQIALQLDRYLDFITGLRTCPDMLKRFKRIINQIPLISGGSKTSVNTQSETHQIPVGAVKFGSLRRLTPISRDWGFDRGRPIDRYYIERFLEANATHIQGRVLEIGDNSYTRRFGENRVTHSDVLHIEEGNPQATIIADLANAEYIPSEMFDCLIITQTLHLIYDQRGAISTLHRMLKPGGILLVTIPGISQICREEIDRWGDYWRYTRRSAQRLFEERFGIGNVVVESFGNVLAALSFLQGLAVEELKEEELDYRDSDYEVTITVQAVKAR